MTTASNQVQAATRQPSPDKSSVLVNELMACLTLIRPANMSDEAASDWVAVAAGQLSDLSEYEIRKGANAARNECQFHSQIIPTIRKANAETIAYRKQSDALMWGVRSEARPQLGYSAAKQIGQVKALQHIEVSDD